MTDSPRHFSYGTPLDEWIQAIPAELPRDAVGLWQVSNGLKRGFALSEAALQSSIRESVRVLLDAGAVPVFGSSEDRCWKRAEEFGGTDDVIVEKVMNYLAELGRDPDVGDLWLALPSIIERDRGA